MTSQPVENSTRRWIAGAVATMGVVVAAWAMLTVYTSAGTRECYARYERAHTTRDSAGVDSLVPVSDSGPDKATCGMRRTFARWQ